MIKPLADDLAVDLHKRAFRQSLLISYGTKKQDDEIQNRLKKPVWLLASAALSASSILSRHLNLNRGYQMCHLEAAQVPAPQ